MTPDDLNEAVAVLGRMLDALASCAPTQRGRPGSDLRRAIGDLRADAAMLIAAATLSATLINCFTLARLAGATLLTMGAVRTEIEGEMPAGLAGVAVAQAGIRFALAQEARIVAAVVFTSRQDVDATLARFNDAFADAEEYAADNLDAANYQALVALHASVTRYLVDTARPLPRMINFEFPQRMPALTMANRIYADASREDELIAENKAVHPAFMPRQIKALSA